MACTSVTSLISVFAVQRRKVVIAILQMDKERWKEGRGEGGLNSLLFKSTATDSTTAPIEEIIPLPIISRLNH